jgi:hypothetical protein
MQRIIPWFMISLMLGGCLWSEQKLASSAETPTGNVLLGLARQAVGGAERLESLESLSATGKLRRVMGKMGQSGEIQITLLVPDKYRREETLNMPSGPEITMITALDGNQVWRDMRGKLGSPAFPRGRTDEDNFKSMELREIRAEFARQMLVLLLIGPDVMNLEFQNAEKAGSDDGRADVLDIKGADEFSARLFLDKKTNLPLMLTYRERVPRMNQMMPLPPFAQGNKKMPPEPPEFSMGQMPEMATAEIQLALVAYKNVSGLQLPHHFTRSMDGKVVEEWTVSKYKINPHLNLDDFKKN